MPYVCTASSAMVIAGVREEQGTGDHDHLGVEDLALDDPAVFLHVEDRAQGAAQEPISRVETQMKRRRSRGFRSGFAPRPPRPMTSRVNSTTRCEAGRIRNT
jgi:hypothetical protein